MYRKAETSFITAVFVIVAALGFFIVQDTGSREGNINDRAEVHFLDVGQGDAVLFEKGSEQTLVDTGPDGEILSKLGQKMPISDKTIEAVIITHPHADHLGGLPYIVRAYQIEKIYFNGFSYESPQFQEFLSIINEKKIPTTRLVAGSELEQAGWRLNILWPPEKTEITEINDTSLVISAKIGRSGVLLTGDVSASILRSLSSNLGGVDILKVPHHGSKSGIDKEVVNLLGPHYAVIMVGENSYGHPSMDVLDLLRGSVILRTDEDGSISFWANDEGVFLY